MTQITLHHGDLPDDLDLGSVVAVDTETMGLRVPRDRLCLVQLSSGDGTAHLVQLNDGRYAAPNLQRLLGDPKVLKLFHFARFDLAVLKHWLKVECQPIYCTKIASKLVRTFTDRHGLKDLCQEMLGVSLSKQQQSSDWGAAELTQQQRAYAAADVLHLHGLKQALDVMLAREKRAAYAQACFDFLPTRAALDLAGWDQVDIFAHS
ncbi:ribonuclease D [Algihabitans albus]|uniref:ribonuclease D n=1 Tax=Algihabitans albus TaxID=2164067 RepID=UPI000E5C95CA|nr:ribonuclease H-like domain-containing protein [Algihabitans albus]